MKDKYKINEKSFCDVNIVLKLKYKVMAEKSVRDYTKTRDWKSDAFRCLV